MDSQTLDPVRTGRSLVVFTTERSRRHQQLAIEAAPENLQIVMLRNPDRATLVAHLTDARFLLSERAGVIDADLIQSVPRLEMIVRIGTTTFDIELQAAKSAGVTVCYWPIGGAIRVAEHLMLQMLALGKRLRKAESVALEAGSWGESRRTDENTFAFNWSDMNGTTGLWRQTIGIMGFGEIGAELARRLQGWGCSLLYNRRRRLPESTEIDLALKYVDTDTLFRESDYVVNLLPYSANTDLMIGADMIAMMKAGALFVSCGSGSVVDENALGRAVESGRLGGVALDTFEWEPVRPTNPLIALAKAGCNVVLTPHIAGGSRTAALEERRGYYTSITDHLAGREPQFRLV